MRALTLIPLVALFGCGFSGPEAGDWQVDDERMINDSCSSSDTGAVVGDTGGAAPSLFTLTVDAEDENVFVIGDPEDTTGDSDFSCTREGKSFECDAWTMEMDYSKWSMDALVGMSIQLTGDFSSSTSGIFSQSLAMTCTGADCETLDMENCDGLWEFDVSFVE